ncbi:hypothetical protein Slin15195_G118000 [Septoria linicola]|uniref:Uncharacterized protein n=1 Tax=Septoria linicola TaxID=215465 RepID=A0A9Q9B8U5_9PEZI|nr:hypothetical protein Slin15195_G118000 [Septoria linicola]
MENKRIPPEVLEHILRYLQPPSPETLGRARYEHIEYAAENAEAVNQYTATSHEQLLPSLKTDDEDYRLQILTLSRATRACRLLEQIGRPLLYESYPGQPVAGLQAFNRTLLTRPDLARMVKHITIDQWDLNLMQSLDRWWKDKLSRIGFGQKLVAALVQKAEAGIEDAQVALLLTLCTNTRSIDISAPILLHSSVAVLMIKEMAQ